MKKYRRTLATLALLMLLNGCAANAQTIETEPPTTTVVKDQPEHRYSDCNDGRGFRSDIEKASCYRFDGSKITVLDPRKQDGTVLYEMEVYQGEQQMADTPCLGQMEEMLLHMSVETKCCRDREAGI